MAKAVPIPQQLFAAKTRGLLPLFEQAAREWNVPAGILLAVASRETQLGTDSYYLKNGFTGRDGHGKGIMQIDDRFHSFARVTAPNDHEKMIGYGARFLSQLRDRFGSMKEALAAYNAGPDAIYNARRLEVDPDQFTTGGDYSRDVMRRAEMIKDELGLGTSKALAMTGAIAAFVVGTGFLINQYATTNS